MADNANFAGDRLRLASFLRVVGKGMPQRPSRFKRRPQDIVDRPHAYSSASPNRNDPASPILNKSTGPSAWSYINTAETVGASKGAQNLQANVHQRSKPAVNGDAANIDSHQQMPAELCLSPNIGNIRHDAGDSQSSPQPHLNPLPIKKNRKKAQIRRVLKTKGTSNSPRGTLCTRARRLPVNGLALRRTTPSDGLPAPSDANTVFATPVTDIDPIQDSQAMSSLTFSKLRLQSLENGAILKQRDSPPIHKTQKSRESHVTIVRPTKDLARIQQMLPTSHSSREHPQPRFGDNCDGFIGSELSYVLKKSSRQRGKTAPVERNIAVTRGLALAGGFLPVSTVESNEISVPTERFNSRCYDNSQAPFVPEHFQDMTRRGQLPMVKNQSVAEDEQIGKHRSQQWDMAVRNQLSSITAPVRHVSESSELGPSTEESSYSSEDVSDTDNNATSSSQFVPMVRAPSCAASPSYLDHTIYHLDGADLEEEFWSEYNAIN